MTNLLNKATNESTTASNLKTMVLIEDVSNRQRKSRYRRKCQKINLAQIYTFASLLYTYNHDVLF